MELIQRKGKLYRAAMLKDKKCAKMEIQTQWRESAVWYGSLRDGISSEFHM